ncbi:MAG: flagellar biosynthesis protein FlhB [Alphaproteobacteria bacterium]|nr:flagellar biosynthesis protein FlhB [Alphaproteobacteria bacterium]OJV13469.1 MAG: flagellar biosynthesis protein FlhB [Alphaproteobacteria bacterium 33-17]
MAEEGEDKSQKTEDPTPRRLEEALKRGQIIYSKEVTNFLVFLAIVAIVWQGLPIIGRQAIFDFRKYIQRPDEFGLTENLLKEILYEVSLDFMLLSLVPACVVMVMAIVSVFVQNGQINFSAEPLIPKFEKISPIKGLGRLFSTKTVVELVKGLIKLTITGVICYLTVKSSLKRLKTIYDHEIFSVITFIHSMAKELVLSVAIILFFMAIFDYLYQRFDYMQNLRMSRHELKEEYKETEGSPEIKAKLKKMRSERANKRMLANVPKADVIITNPTHYAVALQYDPQTMPAPMVIAKGVDHMAFKIRDIGTKNNVPIVENPSLARDLHRLVEVDESIPLDLYQTVAEVISYVYKIKGKSL